MKIFLHRSAAVSVCLLTLVWSTRLTADVTGSIVGAVRDSSGRVIPKAQLVATEVDTNTSKATSSESDGQYHLLALPAGRYRITVSAPGFQQFVTNDVDLKVNDQLRIDATLSPGAVQERVTVEANAVQVESESTQLGGTLESAQILAMPLNGRSFLDLMPLQSGVAPVTSGTIPNDRPVSGLISNPGNVSVNGQPESANQFLVNGGDVNEGKDMGAGLIPNLDSIQEFRLITNSYDAEYGKFSGAIVNAITKSGTNSIHGDAFDFLRNSDMDARSFFEPSVGELRRNQFGYAVGGPLWKNRLFWFSDYQGTRQVQGADTGLIQVPTQAEKQGIFNPSQLTGVVQGSYWAQVLSQRLGYPVTNGEAYTSVFPGGVIPTQAFDPVAVNELKYFPVANVDPASGLYDNNSAKATVSDNKIGERVDFVNQKTGTWSFYYHLDNTLAVNPLSGQAYMPQPALPGFPDSAPQRAQMFTVSNTKTFGPSMVNEARLSFFRTRIQTAEPSSSTTASLSSQGFTTGVGTLGINPSGPTGYPQSLPPLQFNNYSIGNNWLNLYQANTTYQAFDALSKVVGSHQLKFGGEYRYYYLNVRNICGPNGYFSFNGQETGSDFADFLLGAPAGYVQCSEQFLNNRAKYGGLFIQDSWKARPNLTVNLGLRWEVDQPWSDTEGEVETVVPGAQSKLFPTAPPGLLVPGDPGVPSTVSPTQWNRFAPRVGVAWSPSVSDGILEKILGGRNQTSIRAAYGIYYLGPADLGNFTLIGDAPFGLYWASTAPPELDTPFVTRSTGQSQGERFPYTFPVIGTAANANLNFAPYFPMYEFTYYDRNKLTYAEHYNFSIQRQLSASTVLTIAYVGTQSHHVQATLYPGEGSASLCQQLNAEGATPACGPGSETSTFTLPNGSQVYGTLLPVGNAALGLGPLNNQAIGQTYHTVVYGPSAWLADVGNSNYNALQVTAQRRARDVTFLIAYTYSKSIDDYNGTLNPSNFALSRVLSPFDLTHNFVASYTWEIPFDRAFGALPKRLTQGWTISGISRFSTGFPVTLSQSNDNALTAIGLDVPFVTGPVVTQNPRNAGPNGPNTYFLPSSFAAEAVGQLGNAAVRSFHGPGIINTDFGASKSIAINERMSIMLRGEFFNIFNHANFTGVVGNIASSEFGTATGTMPGRIGQVSGKLIF